MIKLRGQLNHFTKTYLLLIQHLLGCHPLGCPLKTQIEMEEKGDVALNEQQQFVDNHQRYILHRLFTPRLIGTKTKNGLSAQYPPQTQKEIGESTAATYQQQLKETLTEIVTSVRRVAPIRFRGFAAAFPLM